MLSTKFLLIRSERALSAGNLICAAHFAERATALEADYGTPEHETACWKAWRRCQVQLNELLMPVVC